MPKSPAIDRLISKVASIYGVESTLYQNLSRFKTAARTNDRIMDVSTILRDYALQNASIFEERGRGLGFFDAFKRMLAPRPAGTGDSLHKALAAAEGKVACTFCATILGKVFTNHNYSECRNRQNPALLERLVREGKLTEGGQPGPNAGEKAGFQGLYRRRPQQDWGTEGICKIGHQRQRLRPLRRCGPRRRQLRVPPWRSRARREATGGHGKVGLRSSILQEPASRFHPTLVIP